VSQKLPGGQKQSADDSPAAAADLSLVLLATTPASDTYTFAELDRMFRRVGFPRTELHELPPMRVVMAYR
jgi:hypothetical protein